MVEISVSRSIGSVDQCLWKRLVLVGEIIVFFSPSSCSSLLTSSHNKTTLALASTTEFEKSWSYWRNSEKVVQRKKLKLKNKEERIKSKRKKEQEKKRPEMV